MIKGIVLIFRDAIFCAFLLYIYSAFTGSAAVGSLVEPAFLGVAFLSFIIRFFGMLFKHAGESAEREKRERLARGPSYFSRFLSNVFSSSSNTDTSGAVICPNCRYGKVTYVYKDIMGHNSEGKKPCSHCHGTGRIRG